jgi:hypothetical protein
VRAGTLTIDKRIQGNKDRKPDKANQQAAARLAEQEKSIIIETGGVIMMVEADGSSLAIAEVLRQVRTDMGETQKLLRAAKVGKQAQLIGQDAIDTLEDVIEAVTKAQKNHKPQKPAVLPVLQHKMDNGIAALIDQLTAIQTLENKVEERLEGFHGIGLW